MHEHGIVHGFNQTLKQLFTILQLRAALLEIFEQFIDRRAQLAQRARLRTRREPARGAAFVDEKLNLAREIIDRARLAPLPNEKHDDAHCQNSRGEKPQRKRREDQR